MPSVKSYQNRKREIELLKREIQRYALYLENKDLIISSLEAQLNYMANMIADNAALQVNPLHILNNTKEVELLKKEIEALKLTLRLYRDYVLKAYDPDAADIIEIPMCLKPLDSIKYVVNKENLSGFDSNT